MRHLLNCQTEVVVEPTNIFFFLIFLLQIGTAHYQLHGLIRNNNNNTTAGRPLVDLNEQQVFPGGFSRRTRLSHALDIYN